jgi:hypothetical protein
VEISSVFDLKSNIIYKCSGCHRIRQLEYLLVDRDGNTLSICRGCKENLLTESSQEGNRVGEESRHETLASVEVSRNVKAVSRGAS